MYRYGVDHLGFSVGGTVRLRFDGANVKVNTTGGLLPETDNTQQLGSTSNAWNRVYSANGSAAAPAFTFGDRTGDGMYTSSTFTYLQHGGSTILSGNASNQIYIGGMTSSAGAGIVHYNGTQLHFQASSSRYKQDIRDVDLDTSKLKDLRFIEYKYIDNPQEGFHIGVIAEEVFDVYGEDYILRGTPMDKDDPDEDFEGLIENIDKDALLMTALKAIVELQEKVSALEAA